MIVSRMLFAFLFVGLLCYGTIVSIRDWYRYTLHTMKQQPKTSIIDYDDLCYAVNRWQANSFIQFVLLLLLLLLLIMLNIVYTKIGTSITEKAFHFTFGTLFQPFSRHQLRSVGGYPASAYIHLYRQRDNKQGRTPYGKPYWRAVESSSIDYFLH